MNLSDEQFEFLKDVSIIIDLVIRQGYRVTFGEAYRTPEQQEIYFRTGKTKTMNSYHLKRLAIDLNFFEGDNYLTSKEALQSIGDYWENLNDKNSWGGNWQSFTDTPHFERRV